ncbi:MAG: glycosyltransferase [Elusimicrobiaceae bacterium]|nr:glycosyltransferase [Elusimicrobiaceae bacterium]
MKIGIQAWGSAGDVRPLLALGGELAARGHSVTLAVTPVDNRDYAVLANNLGVELRMLRSPFPTRAGLAAVAPAVMGRGLQVRQFMASLELMLFSMERDMTDAALRLARENDVLIGHTLAYPLNAAAAKFSKPYITQALSALAVPSGEYPPDHLYPLAFLKNSRLNRAAWRFTDLTAGLLFLRRMNRLRAELGVAPVKSFLDEGVASPLLNLISASVALCPPRPDWAGRNEVCGFFEVPAARTDLPQEPGISEFIASGSPPVFMGFGSMSDFDPEPAALETLFETAARLAGTRAIIQLPGRPTEARGAVLVTGSAEHRAILPRCSAIVHHGGAGTTHTALLCGTPQIIVSHLADQPYWGRIISAHGLGPAHLARAGLTAPELARRIKLVLPDDGYKRRAQAAARFVKTEHGTALAADLIERTCG